MAEVPSIRVMISSTRADLDRYRRAASKIIGRLAEEKAKRLQLLEVSMEKEVQTGEGERPAAVSRRWVRESDWIVVIVAWHYGSISSEPDSAGLGFTEWEFEQARAGRKRIFLFVAGDPGRGSAPPRRAAARDDLERWKDPTGEHWPQLAHFREKLGEFHLDFFGSLPAFRARIEKTLREAIDNELDRRLREEIEPSSLLAELIINVGPGIRDFTAKVRRIHACKSIHDCLHDHLQRAIRPLQELVLPPWHQNRTLSAELEGFIRGRIGDLRELRGELRGRLRDLTGAVADDHEDLRRSVEAVLKAPELWDLESGSRPDVGEFDERIDKFARSVRRAFRDADESIRGEERVVDDLYPKLQRAILQAPMRKLLSPSEEGLLTQRLDAVDEMRARLAEALETHHRWQGVHDAMEDLLTCRGSNYFASRLDAFCQKDRLTLIDLLRAELASDRIEPGYAVAPTEGGGEVRPPDLRKLLQQLEASSASPDASRDFEGICRPFYDAFWFVDKRTKAVVDEAKRRVDLFEAFLLDLEKAHRKASVAKGEA